MPRLDLNALTATITADAVQHANDLHRLLRQRTGASASAVGAALRRLIDRQWLQRDGTRHHPRYRPGLLRQVIRGYELAGLSEDLPWARDFAPYFALPAEVRRMAQHAFGELLNNAIDHSGGTRVTISLRQTPSHLQLLVSDDGRGIFDGIREHFAIDEPGRAMFELSKGKLTSQPARHRGRGLYFSSRLADIFDLHANEAAFQRRDWLGDGWLPGRALPRQGSSAYLAIALDTTRTLDSVLKAHSLDGRGFAFERTSVPLRLLTSDSVGLDSRAQARRVAHRLGQFRRAEIDFAGIGQIGHSFADELFRVMAAQSPEVTLVPTNMSVDVAAMIEAVHA